GLEDYEAAIDNAIAMAMYDLSNVGELEFKWMLWHNVDYARKRLHESIAEDVNSERVHQHLAVAEALHDYETMLPLIEVFSKNYDEDQGFIWLIQFLAKAGKYDEAALNITTFMEGTEGEDLYFLTVERCGYYRLAGEYDKALADASRLIELIPEEVYGYYTRGWIYELMGNNEAAMADYNRGIEVDDTYAYIYLMRGEQYLKMGETELAKADFERVLELDTEVTDGSCRHYALHFLGRDNEAIEWIERIIETDPYKPGYRYDEACLYARMGNVERALGALRLALSLGYKAKAHIENDDELDPIRYTEAYQRLMEEYFNE
ncbi:MAG: aspartic protease, partial [Alistipes sp.]|nr:aspartic protease [Alistipes sp.]